MEENLLPVTRFYCFGPFCLDMGRLLVFRDGQVLPLAPRLFRVLSLLVQNHGQNVGRDYLMDKLWPDTAVEEGNLTVIISVLRKTLGDSLDQHRYIVTIPGYGYRFVPDVLESSSHPPTHVSATSTPTSRLPVERMDNVPSDLQELHSPQKMIIWGSVSALLAVSLIGALIVRARTTAKANGPQAMAVIPFESIGFGPEDEYLGLGMADAITSRLRNMKSIIVRQNREILPSRSSESDPLSLGHKLNVSVLLTGTVIKVGERINVKAKLLHANDGSIAWSEEFGGDTKEVLRIQDHIAESVASTLTQDLTVPEKLDSLQLYTKNVDAYQRYLRGRYFLKHRTRSSAEEDLQKAIGYFQQAIERDQNFSQAYAGLAVAYSRMSWYLPAEDSFVKAEAAAEKALTINSNLPEAYRSLATAKQGYDWDFVAADAAYRRSIELDPDDTITHRAYAELLMAMGRNEEAEHELKRVQELDPEFTVYDNLGHVYFYSRRYREAFLQMQGKQNIFPDTFWYLAWIYSLRKAELGNIADPTLSPPITRDPQASQCELAFTHMSNVNEKVVNLCILSLQKGATTSDISPYRIALLYIASDKKDQAFSWLDRARQLHNWDISYIKVDPRVDELRGDARFNALLERMHLTP